MEICGKMASNKELRNRKKGNSLISKEARKQKNREAAVEKDAKQIYDELMAVFEGLIEDFKEQYPDDTGYMTLVDSTASISINKPEDDGQIIHIVNPLQEL